MKNLFNLKGKNCLITGSSRGLGFAMAKGMGEAGANLIINGRNKKNLEKSVGMLQQEGIDNVHGYTFDIIDKKEIVQKIALIEKEVGPIDILVNNAGINKRGPLEEISEELWCEVIDINLKGAFLVSQQVVKGMIKRRAGKIINTCSLMSELGRNTIAPYAASKGGLKMLTKNMAVEWAQYNIQVNGIGPGYFITDMTEPLRADHDFDQWLKNRTPARRWGYPEELVGALIFLSTPASDFVNGQIIYVDGGILATI